MLLCFSDWSRQQNWRTFPIDHSDWVLLRPVIPWRWRPLLPKHPVSAHPIWRNLEGIGLSLLFHCSSKFGGLFTDNTCHGLPLASCGGILTGAFCLNLLAWLKLAASKRVSCARTATRATVTRADQPSWLFLLADPFHGGKLKPGNPSPPPLGQFLCYSNPMYHEGP